MFLVFFIILLSFKDLDFCVWKNIFNVLGILVKFIQILKTSCNVRKLYLSWILFFSDNIYISKFLYNPYVHLTSVLSHYTDRDVFNP